MAGHGYLVGEEGPEVALFNQSGTILPNTHPLTQMALNGGSTRRGAGGNTHIHNHHYHFHQDAEGIKKSRRQIERQMVTSLRSASALA
jgi:hypothetical protein